MDLSSLTLRLVFLAIPGLIASKIYRKLRGRTQRQPWEDFTEVLIFSILSYAIYVLGLEIYSWLILSRPENTPHAANLSVQSATVLQTVFDETTPLDWKGILFASPIGVILSLGAARIHNVKLVNNFARWLRVSNRFGDEDVWDYLHNSPDTDWIIVRDHKLNLIYFGAVSLFSDSEKDRELLMTEVSVYNQDSELLYETPSLYFSRHKTDITLELPPKPSPPNITLPESEA